MSSRSRPFVGRFREQVVGRSIRTAVAAFCVSRIVTFPFVYLGHDAREFLAPVPGGWEGVPLWWLNPWTTYDSRWFLSIAESGYDPSTTAFFPLYPLVLRLGGDTIAGMAVAGFVVSNLCFLFSLVLLHRLTSIDFEPAVAERSVWLLAFFPTTAFFSAVYSESLFLLLLLGTFLAARAGHWLRAGTLGLLAATCRNPGILIFAALALEYLQSVQYRWRSVAPLPLAAAFMPLIGFLTVQGYFWTTFGSPFAGIESQSFYHRSLGWPWEPLRKDLLLLFSQEALPLLSLTHLLFIGLALFLAIYYRRVLRTSYAVLVLGILLMHLSYQRIIPVYTIGAIRYLSTTFPFVQLLAKATSRLSRPRPAALLLAGGYLFVCLVFSYLFGRKGFLG